MLELRISISLVIFVQNERKRHTTRSDLLGARTVGNAQILFKDTPGFLRIENAKEERLDRDLIATAASEMRDVDFTLVNIVE